MSGKLTGKTAIITGGAGGIGLAATRLFAKEGARVIIADVNAEAGEVAARETGAEFIKCDVSQSEDVQKVIAACDGKLDIIYNNAGVYWNDEDRSLAEDGERNIALQAVQEGFVAIAPTARAFGKTRTAPDLASDATSSCHDYMLRDLLVGRTPVGERVWDIMKIIDWSLENLPVDPGKIVVSGHSGGGTATLYAGAVDTRIAVCIPSGAFSSYEKSIGTIRHCECNYLPGMLNLGNMGDVAGLVAGRHLCIIQGKDDGIFPVDGAREEFTKTEEIFKAAGKGSCRLAVGNGGHRYYKDPAWKFIHECLD